MKSTHSARSGSAYAVQINGDDLSNLDHIWRFVGYDEPNYTYSTRGVELLRKLGELPDSPYFIRTHFLLCSGDGIARPKWGSTNVCLRDSSGKLRFDWSIWDRIFDAIIQNGCLPFVELGFMPEALTSAPADLRYDDEKAGGWRFPPSDYAQWGELVAEAARHSLNRYGSACVSRWYWELWNEPDIFYWAGTPEEYFRLFDITETSLHSVLPYARLGGPSTTNPANLSAGQFLEAFLDHCISGRNSVSGGRGARLDFITFHAKGGSFAHDPAALKSTPTVGALLAHVQAGLDAVGRRDELRGTEIILSECDPDGWAAGSVRENPNFQYRNTEYYASYFAVTACRLLDLSGENGIRTAGMLTWAFEFEEREYFAGLRTLSTNGVDKPVLNAFRLVSQLRGRRARVEVSPLEPPTGRSGEHLAAVAAVGDGGEIQLLIVHHHDDWDTKNGADVRLSISVPAPAREFRVEEIIVDEESSNSYSAWSKLGRPKDPTVEELAEMNRRAMVSVTQRDLAYDSAPLTMELHLRSHAVHLLRIRPLR